MAVYPQFTAHADAACFNCSGKLLGERASIDSGNRIGRWAQWCSKCNMFTWYDIKGQQS